MGIGGVKGWVEQGQRGALQEGPQGPGWVLGGRQRSRSSRKNTETTECRAWGQ